MKQDQEYVSDETDEVETLSLEEMKEIDIEPRDDELEMTIERSENAARARAVQRFSTA